jgi:predicted RNase H-like HicB family nuclease
MNLIYPAIFTPLTNNPNGYCVVFPDLPGCVTQGDNMEHSIEMAQDAASGWILIDLEEGVGLPKPSARADIKLQLKDEFVNYIQLNMDEYAKKYSKKATKKTLTIPQWLNTAAEEKGINFIRVLQEGLKAQLGLSPDTKIMPAQYVDSKQNIENTTSL